MKYMPRTNTKFKAKQAETTNVYLQPDPSGEGIPTPAHLPTSCLHESLPRAAPMILCASSARSKNDSYSYLHPTTGAAYSESQADLLPSMLPSLNFLTQRAKSPSKPSKGRHKFGPNHIPNPNIDVTHLTYFVDAGRPSHSGHPPTPNSTGSSATTLNPTLLAELRQQSRGGCHLQPGKLSRAIPIPTSQLAPDGPLASGSLQSQVPFLFKS